MTPTDSRPARSTPTRRAGRGTKPRFPSTWGTQIPEVGPVYTIVCPNCGSKGADMDRVANRVYGAHADCGWEDSLRIIRQDGRLALEPWDAA